MTNSNWMDKYRLIRDKYVSFTDKLNSLISEILTKNEIKFTIESRTKDLESFNGKLTRKMKYTDPLKEITDLSGVRIILQSLDDVERVVNILRQSFHVDEANSVNKADMLKPNQFGYLSQHIIIYIDEIRAKMPEWEQFVGLLAEIQIRTALQHAWASVGHGLYKSELEVPFALKRQLNRLSALFELADSELNSIVRYKETLTTQYLEDIEISRLDIEINSDSLSVYLMDEESSWIDQLLIDDVVTLLETGFFGEDFSLLARMLNMSGIVTLQQLKFLFDTPGEWLPFYVTEVYRLFGEEQGTDVPMGAERRDLIEVALVGQYPEIFTFDCLGELEIPHPEIYEKARKSTNDFFQDH